MIFHALFYLIGMLIVILNILFFLAKVIRIRLLGILLVLLMVFIIQTTESVYHLIPKSIDIFQNFLINVNLATKFIFTIIIVKMALMFRLILIVV